MESFVLLLIGLKDWLSDFFHFFLEEVLTDRRRLLKLIAGIAVIVLAIVGIRTGVRYFQQNAAEAAKDPESQMLLPIEVTQTPLPTLAPTSSGVASSGAGTGVSTPASSEGVVSTSTVTAVNEYVQRKNGATGRSVVTKGTAGTGNGNANGSSSAAFDADETDVVHEYVDQDTGE